MIGAFLVSGYPWLLWGLLAAAAACAAAEGKTLRKILTPRAWVMALVITAAGAAGRWARPAVHQVYFDEYEHIDIAATLSRRAAFAEHLAGGLGDLDILRAPTWPGAHHAALSLFMKLAGDDEQAAYAFNTAVGALSILVVILLGAGLFEDEGAGLLAGAFWAALPLHVLFSRAADLTAGALFWAACALLALILDKRARGPRTRLLLLSTLALACHSRFESSVLLPAAAFYLHRRGAALWPSDTLLRAVTALFIAVLLPLPLLVWTNHQSGLPGFTASPAAALRWLLQNLPGNALYFLRRPENAFVLLPAAACGLARLRREPWGGAQAALLLTWGAGCLLVYSSFYRGSFGVSSECRYALALYLPLVLLAGLGVSALARRFKEPRLIPLLAAAGFFSLALPGYRPLAVTSHEEQYRFILETAPSLPAGLYTLSFSPSAVLTAARRPALSPELLDEPAARPWLAGGLVLFKDYWWHERTAQAAKLQARLSREYVSSVISEREIAGKLYGFYRLTPKAPSQAELPRSESGK